MAGINYNNTTKKPAVSDDSFEIDVTTNAPADSDVLTYDNTSGKWVPAAASGGGPLASVGIEDLIEFTTPIQANSQSITSTTYVDCTSMPAVSVTFPEDGVYTFRYDGSVINRTAGGCDMGMRINIDNDTYIADLGLIELANSTSGESWERVNLAAQVFVTAGTYDVKPQFNRPVGSGIPLLEGERRHTLHITKVEANISNVIVTQNVAAEYGDVSIFSSHFDASYPNNPQFFRGIGIGGNTDGNHTFTIPEDGIYRIDLNWQLLLLNFSSGAIDIDFGVLIDIAVGGVLVTYTNADVIQFQQTSKLNGAEAGTSGGAHYPYLRGTLTMFQTLTAGTHTIRPVFSANNSNGNRPEFESGLENMLTITKA